MASSSNSIHSSYIVTLADDARRIAAAAKTVAVLGIKTESQASQPAFYVPEYLQKLGVKIIPVPVYYPGVQRILGEEVVRDLRRIPRSLQVDILDVFRRPQDLPQHLDDILALRPACVWLQSGISNPEFEQALAASGIRVVPDRCLKVDRAAAAAGAGGRSAM